MTGAAAHDPAGRTAPVRPQGIARRVSDISVLTQRNLVHIARQPTRLGDVTLQPVLFTLLFIWVLGAGVTLPGGRSYTDFAVPGLILFNITTSAIGTAIGLSTDLGTGVTDRFRTLPMWNGAVLVGRSVSDLLTMTICILMVAVTGLAIGWRTDARAPAIIAGLAILLLFGYVLIWGCACLGAWSEDAESVTNLGLIILFPLAIISNALVPTARMPAVIRFIAAWNPVSAATAAVRDLWNSPSPPAGIHALPMQHPVPAALIWSASLLAIFVPLAIYLYRKRTTT